MKRVGIIVVVVVILLVFFGIFKWVNSYNKLVEKREAVSSQWSQVENVYQRRADLIPNLVNTVKGYAEHEKETLTSVIQARAKATSVNVNADNLDQASLQKFQQAQQGLSSALSRLMVTVERYPNLKADQNFLGLQAQLEGTENRIAVERRRYNEVAREYNTLILHFPEIIVAKFQGFEKKAYFQADKGADQAPKVQF